MGFAVFRASAAVRPPGLLGRKRGKPLTIGGETGEFIDEL